MVDPVNITNLGTVHYFHALGTWPLTVTRVLDKYYTDIERCKAEEEEIDMRFQAPGKPGMYNFTIYVRSDSYIELG